MKAAIALRKVDPVVVADVIVTADRDRTEMQADQVVDVIVDRVPADEIVGRAAAVGVIATVIVDHADHVRMDLVPRALKRPAVTVDRAKNIVIEIPDGTRVMDLAKADLIVIVTDNARRVDQAGAIVGRAADVRSMHADRAKVDGRKVRADARITHAEAMADRGDKADDRSPNTHAALSPARRRRLRRDLAKKFRDSLRSSSALNRLKQVGAKRADQFHSHPLAQY